MNTTFHLVFFSIIVLSVSTAPSQSAFSDFANALDATLDGAREKREQNEAPANIRVIFAKAKAEEEDGNVNFCGFYVGMSRADAHSLNSHYGLQGEGWFLGDPVVFDIRFTLKGIRRITKGGNSYDELCQAVANRTGNLKLQYDRAGFDEKPETWYEYKTIDGVRLTMSDEKLSRSGIVAGFHLWDSTGNVRAAAERKAAEKRRAAVQSILETMVAIPGKENFRMGKYEVTQAQWEAIMGGNPSEFRGRDNPVENVSWNDCKEFLKKLNELPSVRKSGLTFRLPKATEWEYACRAGATGMYCKLADGTEITEQTLGRVAWYEDNSEMKTHPVGQKEPNAFGIYDMHGNVFEWCEEEIGEAFEQAKGQNIEHDRICRGGCILSKARFCVCPIPFGGASDSRLLDRGFRLCTDSSTNTLKEPVDEIIDSMVQIPFEDYRMGKTEVTQWQWEAVMGENPSLYKDTDRPVENVSWNDCQVFLKKLNDLPTVKASGLMFRLPTVAEWRFACRAGATGNYCKLADGTEISEESLGKVAWFQDNSDRKTHPVGQKQPNAFGLYDMHGNVWEWCQEEFGDLHAWATGQKKHNRIKCGGANDSMARWCESSHADDDRPDSRYNWQGFRLCAEKR